ncbi:histidine/lysine/arginine/ornithine ABC transporter ATP-binding protein [Pseudomonas soli]|uniref:ATP-binding cassette domain-containing protein n=1 Tax=Pseudomonas soli TaxID=1306993 RepID=UPI000D810AED|nr:ATP-binding cassette domain-containing protein [Pseudomonas soli]MDW9405733.1 ATP-binding cassette domain-containing protein [Pseudomonas soli]PYC44561.1 histidine/lysine/arginine/ornithine ABC transporter ATP-binding protein [Pseudomonas soli]
MTTLVIENMFKQYGNQQVLKGVSLTANEGEVISIIGSSGSGKSTFLRCMNLLEKPDAGSIRLGPDSIELGTSLAGHQKKVDQRLLQRMRTRLAMVFQSFNLWSHMTVLENIIEAPIRVLGLKHADASRRAHMYLSQVGLDTYADAYPAHLSGGQQQRVAIARALAMEPDVLLFDEPTSALDPERVGDVLAVMQRLAAEGRTMVVVTHEMAFAREVSSQVVFLHEGVVEEQGSADQVFGRPQSIRLRQFLEGALK